MRLRVTLGVAAAMAGVLLSSCSADEQPDESPGRDAPVAGNPPSQPPPPDEDLLLPDMRSLAPTDLQVVTEDGQRRIRFAGLLANLGSGPMLVRPRGDGDACGPRQVPAQQVIYRDTARDGRFQRGEDPVAVRHSTGCMLDHRDHDHWHFDAMARYTLMDEAGEPLESRAKVSFCLRDNEKVAGAVAPLRRSYFGECSRRGDQGISPGWVDIYTADLDSQYLALPAGAGRYCLQVTADPRDQLIETDETNNTTIIGLQVSGDGVRRVAPACG